MQRTIQIFLISATALIPLNAIAAESAIQQVSWQGCGDNGCSSEGCDSTGGGKHKYCPYRAAHQGRKARRGDLCDGRDCNGRRCNLRSSSRDFALNWCGNCGPIGRLARVGFPGAKTLCWCCNTKAFPDSGWSPPAHVPIQRTGGGYSSYGGSGRYGYSGGGHGPGAPIIYQPTDTTQLGYSYSNVPTWRRNPNMIPGVPNPSNFHTRFCPADSRCGGCSTGCDTECMSGGFMPGNCINGQCMGGQVIMGKVGSGSGPGIVRMRPQQTMPHRVQMVGLPVKAIRPMETQRSVQPQRPQVRMVSNDVQKISATVPPRKPQRPAIVPKQQVRPTVQAQRPKQSQSRSQQRQSNMNRNAGRRTSQRRPRKKQSGGWLGLPSLSEMTF